MKKIFLGMVAVVTMLCAALLVVSCKGKSPPGGGGDIPSIDSVTLGKDYTDLKASIQFKTHRTDIIDSLLNKYVADFQKMYPGIRITYEGITDYAAGMTTRLSTPNWGDICMIPTTVPLTELANYFQPFGTFDKLKEIYNFADNRMYQNVVYGLSSTNNVQGIVYNRRVFQEAGITTLPKTPDEFLAALQKIKANTKAIPLYTNFAAGWTMGAWDAYVGGSATGDTYFMNQVLPHAVNPFSDRGDGTGPYAVYYVLYESIARGLVEDDPSTSDWEGCKAMINRGDIASMVLGSWSIVQMQEAGPNGADIAYMTFPITVNGKQYAASGPDYTYGINRNSSRDVKLASLLYMKYLVEQSNFDYDQGGVPTAKGHPYPSTLSAFDGIELVPDSPTLPGEEDLMTNINVDSEVGLNMDNHHVIEVAEAALTKKKTLKQITDEWNTRWTAAQKKYGAR
ncbi:sugar ABC transporter substrate-binding protein [Spirochaetia bacterium]|nr:sugar ABC transporter substrate-binding protein [Spirochaetia bacterium]